MDDPSDTTDAETDGQLLLRSRDGDRHAFSELWRRHAPVAVAYARSLGSSPPDPEDVVSDAFVSILRQLRAGKGPQRSFRPYLLTTVKNTWMSHARRTPLMSSLDDTEHPPSVLGAIDVEAMVTSAALAEAFDSLPERWQHALWLSEVEQLPPRQIAELLGIRPNSAAALTYRARDALRKAWIRAHLRAAPDGTDHARVIELLGAYAHDDLSPRPERFVTAHLDGCATCRSAAGEARKLARAMTIGPLLAGGAGLVLAPALFPAEQAAAAVVGTTGLSGWAGASAGVQPALHAAGHSAALLWPVAAATAVALSVGGTLFVRPDAAPDATGVLTPTVSASVPAASTPSPSAPQPLPEPAEPTPAAPPAMPDPTLPPAAPPTAPLLDPVETTAPSAAEKPVEIVTKPGNGNAFGNDHKDEAPPARNDADEDGERVDALMSGPRGSSWWSSTVVVRVTTDAKNDTVSIAVWGAGDADLAILVDAQTIGIAPDAVGWSDAFVVTLTEGQHTLSVHYLDADGGIGVVAAQTVFSVG